MSDFAISPSESAGVAAALQYWLARWDWEAPIIFGLSKPEFEAVASTWPNAATSLRAESPHCRAAIGALRELLHGGCAVSPARVQELLGIEPAAAELLLTRLFLHCRGEL